MLVPGWMDLSLLDQVDDGTGGGTRGRPLRCGGRSVIDEVTILVPLHRSASEFGCVNDNLRRLAPHVRIVVSDATGEDDTLERLRSLWVDHSNVSFVGSRPLKRGWVTHYIDLLDRCETTWFMWLPHDDEIDVEGLRAEAVEGDQLSELCLRLRLRPKGPWLTVLGGGNPLNIVMNAGSPEPVLMQFALLGLTLGWLAQGEMNLEAPPAPSMFGCSPVPRELELDVARRALRARR